MEQLYKSYQQMYHDIITDHTDLLSDCAVVVSPEIVKNALQYFDAAVFPLVYPAKSYAVAIIYATLIEKEYGINFYDTLNDPDLFLGQDEHFVTYDEDPKSYDAILEGLKSKTAWLTTGWAPKTVEYFELECTPKGIELHCEGKL